MIACRTEFSAGVYGPIRELVMQIFVPDPHYRPTIDYIKAHAAFKLINWDKAVLRQLSPPFFPDEKEAYHNCNKKFLKLNN